VAGCCECGDEPSGSCATELGLTKTTKISDRRTDVSVDIRICDLWNTNEWLLCSIESSSGIKVVRFNMKRGRS
jgi:hypothetical protein